MSDEEVLLSENRGGVLWLTMNRPERLNAMNQQLMRRLVEETEAAVLDPDVRAVVLTGAGRGFCAGGDASGAREIDEGDPMAAKYAAHKSWSNAQLMYDRLRWQVTTIENLRKMPKPTVAMLRGPVAGAGMGLAMACDFRIASKTVMFTTAFAGVGASGDFGGSYTLTRVVGAAKAMELYMLSDKIRAEEVERLGLVTRLVEDDELEAETEAFVDRLASGPTVAYRYIKRNIYLAESASLSEVLDVECEHMVRVAHTADYREAFMAFREKRKPNFQGK